MSSKIFVKRSSIPNKAPVVGDLDYGEFALNYNDGKLYYLKTDNTIDYFKSGLQTINLTGAITGSGTGDITTTLSNTGVTAGAYTNANITVGVDGRITSVTNGSTSGLPDQTGNTGKYLTTDGSTLSWATVDLSGYQPLDADLTAIGGLTGTSGLLKKTAADAWSLDTNTYLTTTLAASTYQPVDADLTSIAGLSGTSGILKKTALNTWALDTTSYQPLDADLTAIGGLAGTSGLLKKTAVDTWTLDTNTYLTGITSSQVTTALGYTPYDSANPSGYITSSALSSYLALTGGTVTGITTFSNATDSTSTTTGAVKITGGLGVGGNIYGGGSLVMSGNVSGLSDESLKTDWKTLPNTFLNDLAGLKSGEFTRIDTGEIQVGIGAQSLQKFLRHAVVENANGLLSVNYGAAAMVSSVELAKKVLEQDKRIAELERLISKIIGD